MVRFDEELGDIFAVLANREKCVQERDAPVSPVSSIVNLMLGCWEFM